MREQNIHRDRCKTNRVDVEPLILLGGIGIDDLDVLAFYPAELLQSPAQRLNASDFPFGIFGMPKYAKNRNLLCLLRAGAKRPAGGRGCKTNACNEFTPSHVCLASPGRHLRR
jgi:hypothetical protein